MIARASPSLAFGLLLMAVLVGTGLLATFWTPYDPLALAIPDRLAPFSPEHLLGTDQFGRDMASMMMAGLKNSLFVAFLSVTLAACAGSALGFYAALTPHRWFEMLARRITDFMFIFPALLTAIVLATLYGASIFNAIVAIAIFNVPVFFRQARAQAMMLRNEDYVHAAEALGQTRAGILWRHILPGSMSVLVTQGAIQLGLAMLAEAGLSYLGLGIPAPLPSLGRMLQDAQTYMTMAPSLALLPGFVIALSVFAFNLVGDGLRDLLDTRRLQIF